MRARAPQLKGYKTGLGTYADAIKEHPIVFRNFTIFLLAAPLLFTFVYTTLPTVVLFLIGLLFLVSLSPLYSVQHTWLAGLLSGFFIVSTMWSIRTYYAHVVPLNAMREGRSYNNVASNQQAIVVADAAMLQFIDGTVVDDQKAVGMKSLSGGLTYCVAPVTDGSAEGRVNFWAVGVDCCGGIGDFTCADAGQPTTHHGFVVPDPNGSGDDLMYETIGKYLVPASSRREMFLEAITMAQSVHGIAADANFMLVTWDGRTRDQVVAREWMWIAASLGCALIFALSAAAVLTEAGREHGLRYVIKAVLNGMTPAAAELLRRPAKYNRTNNEVRMLGFTLPVVTMVICVTIFSFAPCFFWGNLVKGLFLVSLGVMILTIMMKPRIFEYGVLLLAVACVGSAVGRWNFGQNSFHFCGIYTHKAYSNVLADASSARYQDAGKMYFASNASIAVDKSIGFIYDEVTYCAAPILSQPASAPAPSPPGGAAAAAAPAATPALLSKYRHQGRAREGSTLAADQLAAPAAAPPAPLVGPAFVDFWAVGRGCCDARGGFKCFKDGELTANSGIVLRDSAEHGLYDDVHRGFLLAVQAAADNYNLPLPVNPMLVEWGHDLNLLKRKWLTHAISVILVVAAASFVVFAITSFVRPCSGPRRQSSDDGETGRAPPQPPSSVDQTADFGKRGGPGGRQRAPVAYRG